MAKKPTVDEVEQARVTRIIRKTKNYFLIFLKTSTFSNKS